MTHAGPFRCSLWGSEHHGKKALLLGALDVHVDVVEEAAYPIIGQDFTVKQIDRGIDDGLAADPLKKYTRS